MKNLIHEIHRRSLWQVLGIYLAASWVAIQVVNEIGEAVGLPEWVSGGALVLLVIGFPIVLATAFVQQGISKRPQPEVGPAVAEEVVASPTGASAAPTPVRVPATAAGHHRLFTWKNALLGGVGAFILFGAGTGVWMALRALGIGPAGTLVAKGALEEQALVILADFQAEDATLADAATEALRVDLSQSGIIRLAEPSVIAEALARMGRDPSETLTAELASEIAAREGAGAVITGEINRAGVGHVFSAQVVSTSGGEVLTSQRESAADETDVIAAIDRLSKKLRERIGESFRTIRATPPLARVTTSNLEALRLYSQAFRDDERELALLEQAIALDTAFAMAWRGVGIYFRNRQTERARTVDAFRRAFEHRARLTERERRLAAADYYTNVTHEPEKAVLEYEALLERDPEDITALTNLGVAYNELRDFERSEELSLRKTALRPNEFGTGYWNTVHDQLNLGKFAAARGTVDTAVARLGPGRPMVYLTAIIAGVEGEYDEAEALLSELSARPEVPPGFRHRLESDRAALAATRGRLGEASSQLRTALAAAEGTDQRAEALDVAIQTAWVDLAVRNRSTDGLATLDRILERLPLDDLPALDRPYAKLAELYARGGRPDRARALLTALDAEFPSELRGGIQSEILRAEGEIALAEGRFPDAIASFRRSDRGFCMICALPGLALAYERAGERDSAVVVYERYATTPFSDRFSSYTYALGPALGSTYERLGQLYEEHGDLENAAKYYAMFVELWAEADDELQPRVRAAQARLEEILRERG